MTPDRDTCCRAMSGTDSLLEHCSIVEANGSASLFAHRGPPDPPHRRESDTMDLKTYEQVKFALAELIRSGQLIASEKDKESNKRWEYEQPWRNLLVRLAEDRFALVVAGRFNRGKSSLMNAVLGMDRLPTGIVPLTSVITNVRYGKSERVLLDYYGSGLRSEAKLEDLPQLKRGILEM